MCGLDQRVAVGAILRKVLNGGPLRGRLMSQCPPNDYCITGIFYRHLILTIFALHVIVPE